MTAILGYKCMVCIYIHICVYMCNLSSEYWSSQVQCRLQIKWRYKCIG